MAEGDVSIDVGARVVRGPDWSPDFEDQDGGEGHLGSIVEICGQKENDLYPKQCVVVQWDNGEKNVYRAGYEESYDLRVYDNAGIGVKHDVACSECKLNPIYGMLWSCDSCPDVNLCSECYNGDKHDNQHHFVRYDTVSRADGTKVPKRAISKKLVAMGIFERCKVRRGPDWRWHNQDGGEEKYGEVIALVNFSPDTDHDAAEVTWENGYTNVYRLGYKGRLDVVCLKPVRGGHYYRDHLPILKLDATPASAKRESEATSDPQGADKNTDEAVDKEAARFQEGDKVRIEIDIDVLKMIEENRKAWNDHMVECIGKIGTVLVSEGNDITVDFDTAGKWTFHESVLNKVREFVLGEVVQVNESADHVRMLQTERGGWNDLMVKVVGKKGRVEEIDEDRDVQVNFGDYTWTFNPECLGPAQGPPDNVKHSDEMPKAPVVTERRTGSASEEEKMEDLFELVITGDTEKVNKIIQREPQLMLMDLNGRYAVHLACKQGHVDIVKAMFSCASKENLIEMKDVDEMTPLLAAVSENQIEMVKYLVGEGANKTAKDRSQRGAVHMAVDKQYLALLRVLRDLNFDVNQKDTLKQSPIFDAIIRENEDILDVVLNWPDLDIHYVDGIGFSPFFLAARKGDLKTVQKILSLRALEIREVKANDDFTGLHLAAYNGQAEVVRFLLRQTLVEIDAKNKDGQTALHLACHEGYFNVIKILTDSGSDILLRDNTEKNCLHLFLEGASHKYEGKVEEFRQIVEYLINHGVEVDVPDSLKKCPSDYVVEKLSTEFKNIRVRLGKVRVPGHQTRENLEQKPKVSSFRQPQQEPRGPAFMTQSLRVTRKQGGAQGQRIEDLTNQAENQTPTKNQRLAGNQREPARVQVTADETSSDPDLCESCEEEPIRFRIQPCQHLLCADCIPKRKQKKKVCACCGEEARETEEIRH